MDSLEKPSQTTDVSAPQSVISPEMEVYLARVEGNAQEPASCPEPAPQSVGDAREGGKGAAGEPVL